MASFELFRLMVEHAWLWIFTAASWGLSRVVFGALAWHRTIRAGGRVQGYLDGSISLYLPEHRFECSGLGLRATPA